MSTLSDSRFDALRLQGFTGATSDMLLQWLQANGATSNAVPDAWDEMLALLTYSPGQRNDRWWFYLDMSGYGSAGSQLNDMELVFWESGGVIVPPVSPKGFDSGFDAGCG